MIPAEVALGIACFALGFSIATAIATVWWNRSGVSWRRGRGICRDCPSPASCMSQEFCFGRGDALKRSK